MRQHLFSAVRMSQGCNLALTMWKANWEHSSYERVMGERYFVATCSPKSDCISNYEVNKLRGSFSSLNRIILYMYALKQVSL